MTRYIDRAQFLEACERSAGMTLPDMIAVGSSRAEWTAVAAVVDGLGLDGAGIGAFSTSRGDLPTVAVKLLPRVTVNFFDLDEVMGDIELEELALRMTWTASVNSRGRSATRWAAMSFSYRKGSRPW